MMNLFTNNPIYTCFCLAACGYFTIAAVQGWQNPLNDPSQMSGSGSGLTGTPSHIGSSGHTYSSGSYHGRSSGGFGGSGK